MKRSEWVKKCQELGAVELTITERIPLPRPESKHTISPEELKLQAKRAAARLAIDMLKRIVDSGASKTERLFHHELSGTHKDVTVAIVLLPIPTYFDPEEGLEAVN